METPNMNVRFFCPLPNCGELRTLPTIPFSNGGPEKCLPCKACGERYVYWGKTERKNKEGDKLRWCVYIIIVEPIGQPNPKICCPVCGGLLPPLQLALREHSSKWDALKHIQPPRAHFICPTCEGVFDYWRKLKVIKSHPWRLELKLPEPFRQIKVVGIFPKPRNPVFGDSSQD